MGLRQDLIEKRGVLDQKRSVLSAVFQEAGADLNMDNVKSLTGTSAEKAEGIKNLHTEINDLSVEVDNLAAAVKAAEDAAREHNGDKDKDKAGFKHRGSEDDDPEVEKNKGKSFGQLVAESKAIKGYEGGQGPIAVIKVPDLKTLMTTAAGWAPESTRTGRLVEMAVRPIQVIDLIPLGRTGQTAVVYMEETTVTNNAAETAEAGTYPESALALTQRSSPVEKITTFLPVTDEQIEDVVGIQSYIDNRLRFFLRQRLDSQLLVGNGASPNLRGINNVVGIQTQAATAPGDPDAIYLAMTKIRVTGRTQPNGVVMHPNDWVDFKLLRTADGVYIWGNPADVAPDRIWGLNVAQSDAQTEDTAIVGDFAGSSELVMRRDVEVQASNSHDTYFIEGKQAIRADMRAAFVVYRPAAFCTVTGL